VYATRLPAVTRQFVIVLTATKRPDTALGRYRSARWPSKCRDLGTILRRGSHVGGSRRAVAFSAVYRTISPRSPRGNRGSAATG